MQALGSHLSREKFNGRAIERSRKGNVSLRERLSAGGSRGADTRLICLLTTPPAKSCGCVAGQVWKRLIKKRCDTGVCGNPETLSEKEPQSHAQQDATAGCGTRPRKAHGCLDRNAGKGPSPSWRAGRDPVVASRSEQEGFAEPLGFAAGRRGGESGGTHGVDACGCAG